MEPITLPLVERRKREPTNSYSLNRLAQLILFHDSRKVCFGIWVFVAATVLIAFRRIEGSQWIECVGMAALLIGGGTLTDKWLDKGGGTKNATQTPVP